MTSLSDRAEAAHERLLAAAAELDGFIDDLGLPDDPEDWEVSMMEDAAEAVEDGVRRLWDSMLRRTHAAMLARRRAA